jgi:hypothetical protein
MEQEIEIRFQSLIIGFDKIKETAINDVNKIERKILEKEKVELKFFIKKKRNLKLKEYQIGKLLNKFDKITDSNLNFYQMNQFFQNINK